MAGGLCSFGVVSRRIMALLGKDQLAYVPLWVEGVERSGEMLKCFLEDSMGIE